MKISLRGEMMPQSPIRKLADLADSAKKKGVEVFHLNIGQPDIETPAVFFKAIREFNDDVLSYGPSGGLAELRSVIVDYFRNFNLVIDLDQVWITTGGSEAIIFAMMSICDPGDEIIVVEPFYTNYNGFAVMAQVKLNPVTARVEDGFRLPPKEKIIELITGRTRAILISNPSNPTGTVYTEEEMYILSQICKRHNLYLLSDEVYREFVYDGRRHISALSLPEIDDRVIILDSISKRFSACGARVGYIISRNKEFMTTVLKFAQARLCPPTLEQFGAIMAFKDYFSYIAPVVKRYKRRRDVLFDSLKEIPGVFGLKPEGAFYAVLKLPVEDSEDFTAWLLTNFSLDGKTTMLAPARGFYATPGMGKDEVRIAYVLKADRIIEAIRVLKDALRVYPRCTSS
ncbi:MAG TPA: pyridoxal phosphate-dependent aminotransferase [bacterium (Candidatus Stahlbacteria)]|nr:pyridoxal phosphate-dependent aminotransferase [Candidatus Stahlbacteria bacterium]